VKNKRHVLGVGALTLFLAAGLFAAQVAVGKPPQSGGRNGGQTTTSTTTTTTTSSTTSRTTTTPTTTTSTTVAPPTSTTGPLTGSVSLVDQTWTCNGPVDLTSVTVTMYTKAANAVSLGTGCTGRIGRIDVVTYTQDAIKVGFAHDLTIEGGSVRCYARIGKVHQDGIQVMGAQNLLFQNFDDRCYTSNNSDFFVSINTNYPDVLPQNVVCDGCYLGASTTDSTTGRATNGPSSTVFVVSGAVNSGVRNSTVCPGHYFTLRLLSPTSVNQNNTVSKNCSGP
jgi:hypothetical protein